MRLEVLHVPDCPNLAPLLEGLAQVTELPVAIRVIESDADAARYGMAGSPTLLVDGVDPFAAPEEGACGLSCRLYRDDAGRIVPTPSVEQLRGALAGTAAPDESIDMTTGRQIRVVTRDGRSTWGPAAAVVFVGADAGGGPSAEVPRREALRALGCRRHLRVGGG
ncbi:hypothetical protein ACWF0M_31775 [Kribbella sp. NPDC055110]